MTKCTASLQPSQTPAHALPNTHLAQLFEERAATTPQTVALVDTSRQLTFAQLRQEVDRLCAWLLAQYSPTNGQAFGIFIDDSVDVIVAMVAVVKCGGYYVMLDPNQPLVRLRHMVDQTDMTALLVPPFANSVPHSLPCPSHRLTDIAAAPTDSLPSQATPTVTGDDLAYVLYTSGSTGKPKGVMVPHRAVIRLFFDQTMCSFEGETLLQTAALSFDVSVYEIWGSLIGGATLIRLPKTALSEGRLDTLIRDHQVTTLFLTPALFNAVIDDDPETFRPLKQLILGGEALSASHTFRAKQRFPQLTIINGYGPTESTVWATRYRVQPQDSGARVPIGTALSHTSAHVLDQQLKPIEPGGEGELYLGDIGLAYGYVRGARLTATAFIPNPFGVPGSRLYRTGDWVHLTAHGLIDYLNRVDFQVKIRGFRIECEGIAHALRTHPDLGQTMVTAPLIEGQRVLVAYYTGQFHTSEALREFLAKQLPEYMVPSHFVHLNTFPLSASGKVNRKALPLPVHSVSETIREAPRGAKERLLAELWSTILNVQVDRQAHFFKLGGNSIGVYRMLAKLRHMGWQLTRRDVQEAPTLAELAQRLIQDDTLPTPQHPTAELALDQTLETAIHAHLQQTRVTGDDEPIEALVESVTPLAANQCGLFLHALRNPESKAYYNRQAYRLHGPLDIARLEAACTRWSEQHSAARTTLAWHNLPEPVQVMHRQLPLDWQVWDLRADLDPEKELAKRFKADLEHGFDLVHGPLIRFRLVHLDHHEYRFVVIFQHMMIDGWSLGQLLSTLALNYRDEPSAKPEECNQVRARLSAVQPELEEYRAQLFGDAEEPTPLPFEPGPIPKDAMGRVSSQPIVLPEPVSRQITQVARDQGISVSTVIQAAWSLLLARFAGRSHVTFGVTMAGRPPWCPGAGEAVDMLINTLPMTAHLQPDQTVTQLLQTLHQTQQRLLEIEHLSLEEIARQLHTSFEPSTLNSAVIVRNYPQVSQVLGDNLILEAGAEEAYEPTHFPLVLVGDTTPQFNLKIDYQDSAFRSDEIAHLAKTLAFLLQSLVTGQTLPLRRLAITAGPANADRIQRRFEQAPCLHQWFADTAQRFPQRIAVQYEDTSLTYEALNSKADGWAWALIEHGIQPGDLVGLCFDRGLEMVCATLAVLKAGATYVPVDPKVPQERIHTIFADCQVPLVLTDPSSKAVVPRHFTCLSTEELSSTSTPLEPPNRPVDSHATAYIIFTSGSTGKPKGVRVSHRNVTRLFQATAHQFQFTCEDVWTLFHSYAFDFSVWELWGALLYGGRLVVVPFSVSRDPEAFHRMLRQERVTVLNQTPSAFYTLSRWETETRQAAGDLRVVIFGGESLDPHALADWADTRGTQRPRLVNMYGITETTVHVTYREITREDMARPEASPIGGPLLDLGLYLLDAHLMPVATGAVGELFVAGDGLAKGYLNRPALTAERFVPDPFSNEPGGRLYKSGDLARRTVDGQRCYVGRADHQVKIRGFRIELGEISAALASHPAVREKVVLAHSFEDGRSGLAAYVTVKDEMAAAPHELRDHLAAILPDYMVPASITVLDQFPLNHNGKVDRRRLPAPSSAEPAQRETPKPGIETTLAQAWQHILGHTAIGRHDNFFALGGDSIVAIKAVTTAREMGLQLSLEQLFAAESLSELATMIERAPTGPTVDRQTLQPFALVKPEDRANLPGTLDNAYPLTMLQAGMLYHGERYPESDLYHNYTTYRLEADFQEQDLEQAVVALVARHPVLRTSFQLTGFSEALQLVWRDVPVPLTIRDLRNLGVDQQEAVLHQHLIDERRQKFVLDQAPLIRFTAFRLGDRSFHLTITEHHAIVDGWSVYTLAQELLASYRSLIQGASLVKHPLETQFDSYLALEQHTLQHETARDFWLQELEDAALFRFSNSAPAAPSNQLEKRALPSQLTRALETLAKQSGASLKHVLLAAHFWVMHTYTGETDVVTGLVTNGRDGRKHADQVLGLFLNTVPMRLALTGGTWAELVHHIHALEKKVHPYRRYPMAQIQRELGQGDLFQTAFNYTHFHVLDQLGEGMKLLDHGFFDETNFPLLAQFNVDTLSHQLELHLATIPEMISSDRTRTMADAYIRALEAMATRPHEPYLATPGLSRAEQELVLHTWNPRTKPHSSVASFGQLFSRTVSAHPKSPALHMGEQTLTYEELDRRSNRLAHYLRDQGAKPGSFVALGVSRSFAMIEALVAILKTGAAYVPLDPEYPAERLSFILADCGASILIAERSFTERFETSVPTVILVDGSERPWERMAPEPIQVAANGEHPAYLLYTSGSTGTPKGVIMPCRPLLNLIAWHQDQPGLQRPLTTLQFTSLNFDVSFQEIWSTFATGGSLILIDADKRRDLEALATLIRTAGIQRLFLPFVALQHLAVVYADSQRYPQTLLEVITAGEALKATPELRRMFTALPDARLHNHYGPTECHVVTALSLASAPQAWDDLPTIGRPIAGTCAYILNQRLDAAPVGTPGELFLGGLAVGTGYLGQPRLTAERFIPDRFSSQGERVYRTGDLAAFDESGAIRFLGRVDFQVKFRGFRIEPGEIEVALKKLPGVLDAVVVIKGDQHQQLVAYLRGDGLDTNHIQNLLREHLPEYMVPTAMVCLAHFPTTPSGKVDRRSLPAPHGEDQLGTAEYCAPETVIEEEVVELFAQVLGLDRVGIHDDFFAIGGHSLNATQLAFHIRENFAMDFAVLHLFEDRTAARMATRIETLLLEELAADQAQPEPV